MNRYRYMAMNPQGRELTGTIEADSPTDATEQLEEMSLEVRQVAPQTEPARKGRSVNKAEFLLFNQQLASITQAGLPLEKGLRKVAGDVGSRRLRGVIQELADDLEAGVPVDEAFEKHEHRFPPMYGHLIRAGVRRGRLSEMLVSLTRHVEFRQRSRRTLVEALMYPAVVLVMTIVVSFWLGLQIMPAFLDVVRDDMVSLSGVPRTVFTASLWMPTALIGLVAVVGVLGVVWHLLRYSSDGRVIRERIGINIPLFGKACRAAAVSRLADAMSVVSAARDSLPDALREAGAASGYEMIRRDTAVLAAALEEGRDLEDASDECRLIPPLVVYSLHRAAEADDLPRRMHELSETQWLEAELNHARLRTVLAPLCVFVLGMFIATMTVGIWVPMVHFLQQL
jgi:type II secretory pathway component PulF